MFPPRFLVPVLVLVFAATASAAPVPPPAPDPAAAAVARAKKALDTRVDFALKEATFEELAAFVKAKAGVELVMNIEAGRGLGEQRRNELDRVEDGDTRFSLSARGVRLRDGLATLFSPLGIEAGIVDGGVRVASAERLVELRMRQPVTVAAAAEPLPQVLAGLTARSAVAIAVDPRCAKPAAAATVTLDLDDAPLESTARLAAEVAGFAVVRFGDVLLVTTPDRAKTLRPQADPPAELLEIGMERTAGFGAGGWFIYRVRQRPEPRVKNEN